MASTGSAAETAGDAEFVEELVAAGADEDVEEEVIAPFSANVRSLTSKLLDD
ncbi:hypothetical protein [Streptomyces sp. ICN441]|uniref:hypothetical protein n=1 Tax=Streptomyces sp. ICN441 TaxID=2558286 RepID=UPI00141B136D|nr:hypothetical protein [Streptomyces sp. ICN441]